MVKFMIEVLKIEPVFIPPSDIKALLDEVRDYITIIDVDVDYLAELRNERYTPPPGDPNKCSIGTTDIALNLIKELRPPLITISEFTLHALSDQKSKLNLLIKKLKGLGYRIKHGCLVPSDKEAKRAIDLSHKMSEAVKYAFKSIIKDPSDIRKLDTIVLSFFLKFYGRLIKVDKLE